MRRPLLACLLSLAPTAAFAAGQCPVATVFDLWREAVCDIGNAPPDFEARAAGFLAAPRMAEMPSAQTVTAFHVLLEDGFMVQFGGQEAGEKIAADFAMLVDRRGLAPLRDEERAQIAAGAEAALAQGDMSPDGAAPIFRTMVEARDHRLLYLADYGFFVVPEEIWCKWLNVRLVKGMALTEWYDFETDPHPETLGLLRPGPDRSCMEMMLA